MAFIGENIPSQEYTAHNKDGSTFPMKIYISPFFRENSFAGYRAVCVDITEEKLAKKALLQTNKQLNLMTNITRHDILNKVTALYGLQDISLELSNDLVLTEYLQKQQHITKIIQEHIEFTRFYQEIGLEAPLWQDLKQKILYAISKIDTTLISIEVNIHNHLIYADQLLNNVFLNIIENSIRHGDHVTKIIVSTKETENELIIIYMDDGIGVPIERKERIFEEGYGSHTGFGLFLIREILSITGISIKENGTYGSGVRFEIFVPKEGYKIGSDYLIIPDAL
jgi:signal transduction histidine kinase